VKPNRIFAHRLRPIQNFSIVHERSHPNRTPPAFKLKRKTTQPAGKNALLSPSRTLLGGGSILFDQTAVNRGTARRVVLAGTKEAHETGGLALKPTQKVTVPFDVERIFYGQVKSIVNLDSNQEQLGRQWAGLWVA
jgi:hypothetical protein